MAEIIHQIENSRRFLKEPGVILTGELLRYLGHPEEGLPFIHIVGTNGKGSTAAFCASILRKAGYRTGLFTSPHLIRFEERIQVNGVAISEEAAQRLGKRVLSFPKEAGMFDYATAMAVLYFKELQCDIAIMETGVGGRLDSTNALGIPAVTVITPIGFDHMKTLGTTLAQIAEEKAGTIKAGSFVVMHEQEPEVEQVLIRYCKEKKVPYVVAKPEKEIEEYELSLKGDYQKENAAVALYTIKKLERAGFFVPKRALRSGLKQTKWQGRMQQIFEKPDIFIDGAHNLPGVCALKKSLMNLYPGKKFIFCMSVMADKDYDKMIEEMAEIADKFYTASLSEEERALSGEQLAEKIREKGICVESFTDCKQAYSILEKETEDKVICFFGSLYFVGEILNFLQNRKGDF